MDFSAFRQWVLQVAQSENRRWVFRGHASPEWKLETSYGRFYRDVHGADSPFSLNSFWSMLGRFIRRASEQSGINYERDPLVQRIALAQHFGLPTPMLDWSYSPYIAAFFAVTDTTVPRYESATFRIYAMDISGHSGTVERQEEDSMVNGTAGDFRFVDTNSFYSRRVARQAGCFTFQGFAGSLTDWASANPGTPEIIHRDVTGKRSQIVQELELMGITGGSLFDDLDYVAKDIVESERRMRERRRS